MTKLIKQDLSVEQRDKVNKALRFIDLVNKIGKEKGFRVIISGGYAVDGFLGEITRYHNDIDIQIYGTDSDAIRVVNQLLKSIQDKDNSFGNFSVEDKGRKEYYHNLLVRFADIGADLYYLQITTDPFSELKTIVKSDGSLSNPHKYNTNIVSINGTSYEIQDPVTEVVDKIYKREHRGDPKQGKHEQDIKNLEQLISKEEIQKKLQEVLNS